MESATPGNLEYRFDRLGWLSRREYLTRKLLYLDLNFWIRLSEPHSALQGELKGLVSHLVDAGKVLCPVSPSLLMELAKRPRDAERERRSQLMDAFSKGLSLRMAQETFHEEFKAILQGHQAERQAIYSHFLDACVGGLSFSDSEGCPESEIRRMLAPMVASSMFSYLSTMSITEFMSTWMKDATETSVAHLRQGFGEKGREEVEWRQRNVLTSKRVDKLIEQAEFMGTFQALSQEMQYISRIIDPKLLPNTESSLVTILDTCPSFWCHYKVMSAIRSNRRAVEENDVWDFLHVALAVPYVDCLACDRGTRHICSNVLRMDKKYGTRIISKESELLAWLRELY